jgi:hypothetical protein
MAQFTTYDAIGMSEDVADVITTITPTKTPFQSSISKESIDARRHDWQEDALDAVIDNAEVEGFTAADLTLVPTVLRSNFTQIFSRTIKISETEERVKKYGRKSEVAYQLAKKGAEAKRNLENTLVGLIQASTVGTSAVARRMANVPSQIAAGVSNTNGAVGRAFSEALVLDVLSKLYNAGGEAEILMIKPGDASIVADFAKATGRVRDINNEAKATQVINAVDLYVSPWGEVKVVINRFIKPAALGEALLYSPDNWKLLVLRDWKRTPLAVTGDNEMHMLVGEFSLKHLHQSISGRIADLN